MLLNLPQYLYFLFGLAIFSIVFGLKNRTLFSKIVGLFFILLLINEFICNAIPNSDVDYNFWYPVEFTFYCWFLYTYMIFKYKRTLLIIQFFVLLYCYSYNILNWEKLSAFYTFGYSINILVLFIFVIIKTYELLTDENDIRFPFKIPLVWFLLGLFFNLFSFLIFGMKNYIVEKNYNLYILLQHYNQLLSSLQYVCFIIYFYCSWKFQNWNL